ncbi:MAG: hypothetical protein AB7D36_05565 [Oscillospiraceae bacterium]
MEKTITEKLYKEVTRRRFQYEFNRDHSNNSELIERNLHKFDEAKRCFKIAFGKSFDEYEAEIE